MFRRTDISNKMFQYVEKNVWCGCLFSQKEDIGDRNTK